MKTLITLCTFALLLGANPSTLLDAQSGFYKNNSKQMIALYKTSSMKEVINQIPLDAVCIIALKRYKNGKAYLEYKGQRAWIDVSENPDDIILMHYEEMQIPTTLACSQVGSYFFEVQSIEEGKGVKLYEKASTASKVVTTLSDHESCLVNLGCEWPWCRVDTGEYIGWVLSINLTDTLKHVDGYCYAREIKFLEE